MPVPSRDADAPSGGNAASRMGGLASRMGGPGGLGNPEPAALASSALSDVSGGAGSVVVVTAPEQQGAFGGSDAVLLTATTQRLSTGQPPSGGVVDTAHLPTVGATVREWNARAQAVNSRVAAPPLVEEQPASDTAAQERLTAAALATLGSDHGAWGSTPTASLAPEQVGYFESASNSAAPEREATVTGSLTASLTSWVVPPQTATQLSFPASLAATDNATGDTFGSFEVRLSIKWRFYGLLASGLAFSG